MSLADLPLNQEYELDSRALNLLEVFGSRAYPRSAALVTSFKVRSNLTEEESIQARVLCSLTGRTYAVALFYQGERRGYLTACSCRLDLPGATYCPHTADVSEYYMEYLSALQGERDLLRREANPLAELARLNRVWLSKGRRSRGPLTGLRRRNLLWVLGEWAKKFDAVLAAPAPDLFGVRIGDSLGDPLGEFAVAFFGPEEDGALYRVILKALDERGMPSWGCNCDEAAASKSSVCGHVAAVAHQYVKVLREVCVERSNP